MLLNSDVFILGLLLPMPALHQRRCGEALGAGTRPGDVESCPLPFPLVLPDPGCPGHLELLSDRKDQALPQRQPLLLGLADACVSFHTPHI